MPIPSLLACPLPIGLGDGRITDKQLSASSELDHIHAAKQGRASSLISPSNNRYRAADRGAQFNCKDRRTKKFTTSKKITSGILLKAARVSIVLTALPNLHSCVFNSTL